MSKLGPSRETAHVLLGLAALLLLLVSAGACETLADIQDGDDLEVITKASAACSERFADLPTYRGLMADRQSCENRERGKYYLGVFGPQLLVVTVLVCLAGFILARE